MRNHGKAEELTMVKGKEHLWMCMVKRLQHTHKNSWIQAFVMGGKLCLSSPYPKDFDLAKSYLIKMGIVKN